MKLKKKYTKQDDIPEQYRALYSEKDGEWVVDIDGEEDTSSLLRAKQHEKDQRKKAEQQTRELQAKIDEMQDQMEDLQAGGESQKLQRQVEKLTKQLTEATEKSTTGDAAWRARFEKQFLETTAQKLAGELSDSPDLMLPHIRGGLAMDFEGDEPVVRVKGSDGSFSDVSLDDFKKGFNDNPSFAPLLRGSSASGGGADPQKGGSGGNSLKKPDFLTASTKEIAAWAAANQPQE